MLRDIKEVLISRETLQIDGFENLIVLRQEFFSGDLQIKYNFYQNPR